MKKMNLSEIQELIKFVAKSGATEVDLEFEGVKISINDLTLKKTKRIEFKFDGGITEFVDFLDDKREKLKNKNGNDLF